MKTVLATVQLDENGQCLPRQPIKTYEEATPEEIEEKLNQLIATYPVRDAAYSALLRIRFLLERLYVDTANPNDTTQSYTNIAMFLAVSNWDRVMGMITNSIKERHEAQKEKASGALEKAKLMGTQAKEKAGISLVKSALDFVKGLMESKLSESFSVAEYDKILNTLSENKPLYIGELETILSALEAVFTSDEAELNPEKTERFFVSVRSGVDFLKTQNLTTWAYSIP